MKRYRSLYGIFLLVLLLTLSSLGTAAAPVSYAVVYSGNGNTSGVVPSGATSYTAGAKVTVAGNTGNLAKSGYTFAGWNTAASGTGTTFAPGATFTMGSASLTLYAKWTLIPTYIVAYSGNMSTSGKAPADSNKYAAGAKVTVLGNTGNLAKSGYSFAGWNTTASGTGTAYASGTTFTMGSTNVILYAKWTLIPTYAVTYSGNGNTSGTAPLSSVKCATGTKVTVLGNSGALARTGYAFSGWNTAANGSGTAYAPGAMFTMASTNVVLYANWTPLPRYTVTYSGNGSTSGTAPTDNNKYLAGTKVTVLGNSGTLAKTGYIFSGWNTAANGSGTAYVSGATFTVGSANVTLYAQWATAGASHKVTYAGNGSTSGFGPSDPNLYAPSEQVTVLGNIGYLFNPGHVFTGWNTGANGNGTAYTPGSILTISNSDVTLYAQWKQENGVVSVWGGARNALVLKSDGSVWQWGLNAHGQLGDGTTTDASVPMRVLGPDGMGYLSGIVDIMGGEQHNFALKSDGTVWAWGKNLEDQLGDGNATDSDVPVQVSGLSSIVKLGGRGYHSLAVKSDGTVWAWGWDRYGALGIGIADSNYDYPVPVQVEGLSNPIMVSSGFCFSVALLQDHTLVAWGSNEEGQLGDGTNIDRYTPVPVVGISDVIWVSAGWTHVVAIKADGTVWTWGGNYWDGAFPGYGMLGDGTTLDHWTPEQVPGLSGAIQAFGGDGHTAVLLRDGTVWTFGANSAGQLGTGTITTQSLVPVQVQGLNDVVMLTARDFHNQALKSDGTIWSWGSGLNGELGNGTWQNSPVPVQVNPF
jgi:uncharacterized repeat protein (TIGR02543 family)